MTDRSAPPAPAAIDHAALATEQAEVIAGLEGEVGRMVGQIHAMNARLRASNASLRETTIALQAARAEILRLQSQLRSMSERKEAPDG